MTLLLPAEYAKGAGVWKALGVQYKFEILLSDRPGADGV